jgi:hypothetical protein
MSLEIAFSHRCEVHVKLLHASIEIILIFGIQIEVPSVNMAQRMYKHQFLINFYSQFYIEIEWLKHFTKLEACRVDSQWRTFPKWATNIDLGKCWKIGRTFKCGKIGIQPITLNQIAFGHFLSQSFHKGVIWKLKAWSL